MEAVTQLDGMPIANIALAEIVNEATGQSYVFDTADKAEAKPDLSKGKEDILRVKDRIIAMNKTEDICIGYNIKLNNNTFPMEVMCLVDGGTVTSTGYEGPEVGTAVNRTPFTINLYSEQKDYDSSTVKYVKFSFKHNKGTPVDFKFEDGKFYVPEFESTSRPKKGEKPVYIEYVTNLPGTEDYSKATVPNPPTPTSPSGDTPGVNVASDCRITWTYANAINQDDATITNFKLVNKANSANIAGTVTIDDTKKIVTFVPTIMAKGTTYIASAASVRKLDESGNTVAISTEFTTV